MTLEQRWESLGAALGAADARAWRSEGERLLTAWSEPHRHYHSVTHLRACLDTFEPWAAHASRPDLVRLALWVHDALQQTATLVSNEQRSAEWGESILRGAAIPDDGTLRRLVLATAHDGGPIEGDAAWVVDVDLSVLGGSEAEYAAYAAGVRAEYAWVPEAAWRVGRARVLDGLLGSARIFHTAAFASREAAARRNLARERATLV
jgi:predicted metal-dependent HD superfamily phosphohydrolase